MPDMPQTSVDVPPNINSPELKDYVVEQYVKMGMSRDSATKKYESELLEWQNNPG